VSVSRRGFLTYLGLGTYAALRDPVAAAPPGRRRGRGKPSFFDPIAPSTDDRLVLPAGYRYDIVCAWGDPLGSKVPEEWAGGKDQEETFGFNNDFLAYFPIDGREGKANPGEGLLWVNHEYPDPVFVSGYTRDEYRAKKQKTAEQIRAEKMSVGGAVLFVKREPGGRWKAEHRPQFTRRLTAVYSEMEVTGPARELVLTGSKGPVACFGTLANCSGGRTPWLTALSCEENYPDYNEERPDPLIVGYRWGDQPGQAINEEHFGWVVEIDPYDPGRKPVKHTALGHYKHENTALRWDGPGRRLVVYMGDDERDQFLYKYVSHASYEPPAGGTFTPEFRRKCSELLSDGTLYAADFENGRWLPLDLKHPESGPMLKKAKVKHRGGEVTLDSPGLVLLYARDAAKVLGATPLDRPEDCEIHPLDRSLYVALTNNTKRADFHGRIIRLIEDNDDPEGDRFRFEMFLTGGRQSGLSSPDNLAFDREGNLWVACDIASERLGKGPYQPFGNNGLFVVPTAGRWAGDAYQFASGPVGCELTGPWFTDDWQTLFLAVQHPGEGSKTRAEPTSRWPAERKDGPRPAVVAITGFRWG
jgi:uncharacterized protein